MIDTAQLQSWRVCVGLESVCWPGDYVEGSGRQNNVLTPSPAKNFYVLIPGTYKYVTYIIRETQQV